VRPRSPRSWLRRSRRHCFRYPKCKSRARRSQRAKAPERGLTRPHDSRLPPAR
jgi:hypothetical protein